LKNNKYGQGFDIIGRFSTQDTEGATIQYCRVKFVRTGFETVFRNDIIQSLDFEDISLLNIEGSVQAESVLVLKTSEEDGKAIIEAIANTQEVGTITVPISFEATEVPAPTPSEIVAINPKGDHIDVIELELEDFCIENNLELEGVQAVLEGKQKTHKRWRFARA
jgi:hypothetical protein